MSAEKFTQEQIFEEICIYWREDLGLEKPFELDSRIDHHLSNDDFWKLIGLAEECDFADIISGLEECFGFSCLDEEWIRYFGLSARSREEWLQKFAPHFTFRRLVEFIEEHVKPISFEPIPLLGKPCLTAGIFRGLEQLVEQTNPKATRFAPSTPIRERLRGTPLRRFWNRLRWMLDDQIPPLPQITLSSRGFLHSLFFKIGIGLLIAVWRWDFSGVLTGIATTFALLIPIGVIVAFINERLCRLPEGVETFGDLARVLAAIILDQKTEAASCSTP
jgi:hypothetical protein